MESSVDTVVRKGIGAWIGPGTWLAILVSLSLSGPARAADPSEAAPARDQATDRAVESAPKVELGRLLKLPDSYQHPVESRRGMGQSVWQNRFELVRLELHSAQIGLDKAQADLAEAADDSSQWSVAAPGTSPNPENTPLSYKLRQEIRRLRESIGRAEHNLRALEIEADLASVPEEWRAAEVGRRDPRDSASTRETADRVNR